MYWPLILGILNVILIVCLHYVDDMKVTIELFDERPMSASLPTRVTCTVAEAGDANKQSSKSTP